MNQGQQEQEEEKKKQEDMMVIINNFMDSHNLYEGFINTLRDRNQNVEDIDYLQMVELLSETHPHIIDNIAEEIENQEYKQEMEENEARDEEDQLQLETGEKKESVSRQLMIKFIHAKDFQIFRKIKQQEREELRFMICVNFIKERQESKRYLLAANMQFDDMFVFELNFDKYNLGSTDMQSLLKQQGKIEIVILTENQNSLARDVVSCAQIDWRYILSYQANVKETKPIVQFFKFGEDKIAIGSIELALETYPNINSNILVPRERLAYVLKEEKERTNNQFDILYKYSKKWWDDYCQSYPFFIDRLIKLFAENEFGQHVPVVSYITKLQNVKGIDSPYQAARFVSLIPYKRINFGHEERKDIWSKFNTLISRREGEVADHCILLCSLFLGLGLNAYMVIGRNHEGAFQWVMTKEEMGEDTNFYFWDSITGMSYDRKKQQTQILQIFKQIACIFNREEFFANIQEDDYADTTDLNFNDQKKWKRIPKDIFQPLTTYNTTIQFKVPNINCAKIERYVEVKVRNYVQDFRMIYGKTTKFDSKLESVLRQELLQKEYELINRQKISKALQEQFIQAKVNYLHTDKTPPPCIVSCSHFDPKKIFLKIKADKRGLEFLNIEKDRLYFAVKCKLFQYPENFFVLWVVFSIRYQEGL